MQLLSGPNLAKIEQLPIEGLCVIDDHVHTGDHIGDDDILHQLLLKPHSHYISIEYALSDDFDILTIPHYFLTESLSLREELNWIEKTSAFSFSINKLRNNRRLMMEILTREELYTKTYSLGTPQFEDWPAQIYEHDTSKYNGWTIQNGNFQNADVYQELLYPSVFAPSYIHLITEAAWTIRSTFIDEKSVYPFDAGCIPIWVGGWKQPTAFREMGFDVFDDLVDHSYEDLSDPHERLEQAILRNKNLLQNKDLLAEYFQNNQHRFKDNRRLIRSTKPFDYYANKINNLAWPAEYKQNLLDFIQP